MSEPNRQKSAQPHHHESLIQAMDCDLMFEIRSELEISEDTRSCGVSMLN